MILSKGSKNIQWGKESFPQSMWGKLDGHRLLQMNELVSYLVLYTKMNLHSNRYLSVKAKTIRPLEENRWMKLQDARLSNDFFNKTPQEESLAKRFSSELKTFVHQSTLSGKHERKSQTERKNL